jgi:hypothetical protein
MVNASTTRRTEGDRGLRARGAPFRERRDSVSTSRGSTPAPTFSPSQAARSGFPNRRGTLRAGIRCCQGRPAPAHSPLCSRFASEARFAGKPPSGATTTALATRAGAAHARRAAQRHPSRRHGYRPEPSGAPPDQRERRRCVGCSEAGCFSTSCALVPATNSPWLPKRRQDIELSTGRRNSPCPFRRWRDADERLRRRRIERLRGDPRAWPRSACCPRLTPRSWSAGRANPSRCLRPYALVTKDGPGAQPGGLARVAPSQARSRRS